MVFSLVIILLCAVSTTLGQFGPFSQDYGYVEVRPGAHMFWWLFHTTANVSNFTERPLIIWLQGGPGGSSTGYGNFEMIGPMDLNLNKRDTSWVKNFNMIFVDNPVGTGFSYVDNNLLLTTTNEEIAIDLVSMMKGFYDKHPEFEAVPFYIFGQSYGGKMAVDFALRLHQVLRVAWSPVYDAERRPGFQSWVGFTSARQRDIKKGSIKSNLKGVAMGNAWISPVEITLSWAPFLQMVGLLDKKGHDDVMVVAKRMERLFKEGSFKQSTDAWRATQSIILQKTSGVDFYNILTKSARYENKMLRSDDEKIFDMLTYSEYYSQRTWDINILMNTEVKRALRIPSHVNWQTSSQEVFWTLGEDFMKPVTTTVERLLNDTDITVMVYNGNLDLICDTAGQLVWVDRLKWPGAEKYRSSPRLSVWVGNTLEGYYKSYKNFRFYWVNVAGHSAPAENPAAASAFLRDMTSFG